MLLHPWDKTHTLSFSAQQTRQIREHLQIGSVLRERVPVHSWTR